MIADSSFLVALFHPEDELHGKAVSDFSASEATITVPDRVVEEVLTVFSYLDGWGAAMEVLAKILSNRRFEVRHLPEREWAEVARFSNSVAKKLSFTDYLVLYLSSKEGAAPLAYDRQLLKAAKTKR
ncbi:MAG: type II toxin-antitoxin system VapC family toxin [Candidatus Anstonellaceae archaeon]